MDAVEMNRAIEAAFSGLPDELMTDAMAPTFEHGQRIYQKAVTRAQVQAVIDRAKAGKL